MSEAFKGVLESVNDAQQELPSTKEFLKTLFKGLLDTCMQVGKLYAKEKMQDAPFTDLVTFRNLTEIQNAVVDGGMEALVKLSMKFIKKLAGGEANLVSSTGLTFEYKSPVEGDSKLTVTGKMSSG